MILLGGTIYPLIFFFKKIASEIIGGKGGGGRKDFAQAGGNLPEKIEKSYKNSSTSNISFMFAPVLTKLF